jgi:large subunit ribosomal protein L9
MKVILLENVRKVGSIGEIIDVKRGFARNYLISKKKALFASPQNIKEVEKIKQDLSKKDEERKKEAKVINEKIKNKQYEIKKLSTENKELYGSIKPTEISKILEEKEQVKVNPSLIQPSKEIKSLGDFEVLINLHPEVQTQIVIKAVAQEEAK